MANTLKFGDGQWATKYGSTLAYNDENGNFKPLPFTFERRGNATRVNKEGLIEIVGENIPRIDYLNDSNGALLLEPSRTNLETKSNGFSTWGVNSNITRTADYIISPDGTLNGTRFQFTANGFCSNTPQSLATYTVSCYAKRNDNGTQNVGFFTNGSGVVNSAWDITSEWKRFSYTFPTLNASFMGIAGVSGADISVYGFQIEGLVSYPTSYIPTQGGAAVTRLAETCSQTVTDGVIGQTEGTVYADVNFVGSTEAITNQIFFLREQGSNNGYLFAGFYQGKLNCGMRVGGSLLFDAFFSSALTKGRYKIAIAYKSGDTKIYVNGVQTGFKNNSFGLTNFAEILLTGSAGTNQLGDINREFKLYNTRLTDQELAALTQV